MRKLYVLLAVLSALMIGIVGVQAQDSDGETTEDNTKLIVPRLLPDEPYEDFINATFPFQLYRFSGNVGDVVSVSIEAVDNGFDTVMALLGPAGEVLAFDDDGGEGLNSTITDFEVSTQASYFVLVTTYGVLNGSEISGEDDLPYVLNMSGATGEMETSSKDDTPVTEDGEIAYPYFRGAVIFDELFNGYSTLQEPVYYLIFDGTEGQTISVEMTSDEIDTFLYLFAPGGVGIALNDDDSELGGLNSALRDIELPSDGVYLIFATSYGFYQATPDSEYVGGDFELLLTESAAAAPASK